MISQLAGLQTVHTAEQILAEKQLWSKFSTGSKNLDDLLKGGIETHALSEFYGDYGTGKTQLALTLSITAQKDRGENKILFIDTENTFRAARLYQIAENRYFYSPKELLQNILVLRAFNSVQFENLLKRLQAIVFHYAIKLVIVDSLISLYRAEYATKGTIIERQQRLNQQIHILKNVADSYGCAVLVTNQVQIRPDDNFRNYVRATGGNILGHGTTYRIHLRKKGKMRLATMIDSPYHPDGEAEFFVSESGISDEPTEERS